MTPPHVADPLLAAKAAIAAMDAAKREYDAAFGVAVQFGDMIGLRGKVDITRDLAAEACIAYVRSIPFRTIADGATLDDYRAGLNLGTLTPVDQMAMDNVLHDHLAAIRTQPTVAGVAVAWQMRYVGKEYHPESGWQTSEARPIQWYLDHPEYWEVRPLYAAALRERGGEAERYGFLRDRAIDCGMACPVVHHTNAGGNTFQMLGGQELDEAIDRCIERDSHNLDSPYHAALHSPEAGAGGENDHG